MNNLLTIVKIYRFPLEITESAEDNIDTFGDQEVLGYCCETAFDIFQMENSLHKENGALKGCFEKNSGKDRNFI